MQNTKISRIYGRLGLTIGFTAFSVLTMIPLTLAVGGVINKMPVSDTVFAAGYFGCMVVSTLVGGYIGSEIGKKKNTKL